MDASADNYDASAAVDSSVCYGCTTQAMIITIRLQQLMMVHVLHHVLTTCNIYLYNILGN